MWFGNQGKQRPNSARFSSQRRKRLLLEPLEDRRLLATLTWDGSVDNKWNSVSGADTNWESNALPADGDTLIFPASAANQSNQNDTTAGNSYTLQLTGGQYTISGNAITLDNVGDDITRSAGSSHVLTVPFTLDASSTIDITTSGGFLQLNGVLSGSNLIKKGLGDLLLTGTSTYTGTTDVQAGRLQVELGGSINSAGAVTIQDGALVASASTGAINAPINALAGSTVRTFVVPTKTSSLTLGTSTSAGFVTEGSINVNDNSTITLVDSDFAELGPSTLLGGSSANLVAANGVQLSSGDILRGNGTVTGAVDVGAGTLTPGNNSVGDINVTGNLTFGSSGSYDVNINGMASFDTVDVTGSANLGGATLTLFGSYVPQDGDSFVILTTTTGITNEFADLTEGDTLMFNGRSLKISYAGGNVTLTPVPIDYTVDAVDNVTLLYDAGSDEVRIVETGNTSNILTAADKDLIGTVKITGDGDDNELSIDPSFYGLGLDVEFDGAGQTTGDSILLLTGTVTSVTHTFVDANSGSIGIGSTTITYTGLEPVTDNLSATTRTFSFTGGAETITLNDSGGADGMMTIDSTLGESVTFVNPSGSLTINAGTGDDVINIDSFDAALDAQVNINGEDNDDTINVDYSGGVIVSSLSVNGGNGSNTLSIFGTLGTAIGRETHIVDSTTSGRVFIDPDGSGGPGVGLGLGSDGQTLHYSNLQQFNDILPTDRMDIYLAPNAASNVTLADGSTFMSLTTAHFTGDAATTDFANKAVASVNGRSESDTITVNLSTAVSGLSSLLLYGHFQTGDPGAGPENNAGDTFNIQATIVPTSAYGQEGNDVFNIDYTNGVSAVTLTIDGGTGTDTLSTFGTPPITVGRETHIIDGADSGRIFIDPDDSGGAGVGNGLGADGQLLSYSNIDQLNDTLATDRMDVYLPPNAPSSVTISDGPAFMSLTTAHASGDLVATDFANKTVASFSGRSLSDTFTVNLSTTIAGLTGLELYGHFQPGDPGAGPESNAADTFNIEATTVPTSASGQEGDDIFNVGTVANGLDGILAAVTISGGSQTDAADTSASVTAQAQNVTISADPGDMLNILDAANGVDSTYSLTGTTLTRTGVPSITYDTVETLILETSATNSAVVDVATTGGADTFTTITTGSASDNINITLTADGSVLTINGGDGDDTFEVTSTGAGSIVLLNGQGGTSSTFTVQSTGASSGLALTGDTGADIFTLVNTGATSVTRVIGGEGNDVVNLTSTGNDSTTQLDGNAPTNGDAGVPPGDTLNFDLTGANGLSYILGTTIIDGTVNSTNRGSVAYSSFESIAGLFDFGDAPDSFGTTIAANGPIHFATGPTLGTARDTEVDGQPSANALGDGSDEDGVTAANEFFPLHEAKFNVQVSSAGVLNAWADLNNDGDFDDAGEQIANNLAVAAGRVRLSVDLPGDFTGRKLTTRFRITSAALTPSTPGGFAVDGEVEDHVFEVAKNTAPTVTNSFRDLTVDAGTKPRAFNLRNYFSDAQDPVLSFSATSSDGSLVTAIVRGQRLILRFAQRQGGMANIKVTATDVNGKQVSQSFKVTVNLLPTVVRRGSTVEIIGTQGADSIVIHRAQDNFYVYAYIGETRVRIYSTQDVDSFYVDTRAGDDSIVVTRTVTVPTILIGGDGDDSIHGGAGRDIIDGGSGDDVIVGSFGNDILIGGQGNDTLNGGQGNDVIAGNQGADTIFGDLGDDILIGGLGTDTLNDASGRDLIIGSATDDEMRVAALRAAMRDWLAHRSAAAEQDLGQLRNDRVHDSITGDLDGDILRP